MRSISKFSAIAVSFIAIASAAFAHDADMRKRPPGYLAMEMKRAHDLTKIDSSDSARGVFTLSTLWPPSVTHLKVCFLDGGKQARRTVANIANKWNAAKTSIKLDFGNLKNPRMCGNDFAEIRVSFSDPSGGYWSMVGQDSVYRGQSSPSVNLDALDKLTAKQWEEPYYGGVVLHEFGHALGLQHEHQNPIVNCNSEIDWKKAYDYFSSPPPPWPQDQVDYNMRTMFGDDVVAKSFNPDSIMMYSLNPELFKGGTNSPCYHDRNDKLAKSDYRTLSVMYPADMSLRRSGFAKQRAAFKALWEKRDKTPKARSVEIDYYKLYYGASE